MNKERLSQMVTMLRNLPPEPAVKFRLHDWHCGTSACAVGHACLNPWFNEQGLTLNEYGGPDFKGGFGWNAVEEFFGVNQLESRRLFYEGEYADGSETQPAEVADRIESFLATA